MHSERRTRGYLYYPSCHQGGLQSLSVLAPRVGSRMTGSDSRDDGTTDAFALAGHWGTVSNYMHSALGNFVLPSDVVRKAP